MNQVVGREVGVASTFHPLPTGSAAGFCPHPDRPKEAFTCQFTTEGEQK